MELANAILSLCQLSGHRLQVARRQALEVHGVSAAVIRGLHLSTVEDLERAEAQRQSNDEEAGPGTWMTPI
jgi:hypothetical protein